MQPQTRVRRMRRTGQHPGRSQDGERETYYDPEIRRAKRAQRRQDETASRNQDGAQG